MAKITVSPTTYNINDATVNIVKIYFTTDVTLTDIKLSIDNGQNFLNNVSMTQTSADFNVANLENKNYTCLLKGFYEETLTSSYSITNNLTHCTTSNTAKTINANSKYSATITADEGYVLNTITVTMGGTDISSSVVRGSNINIPNVTGDLSITVRTSVHGAITTTWTTGNITSAGVDNNSDTSAMRTDSIEFDTSSYKYYITVSSEYEGIGNIKLYFYNPDGSFKSRKAYTSTSLTPGVAGEITFPIAAGTFRIKTDFGTTNTLENINDRLVITKTLRDTETGTIGNMTNGKGLDRNNSYTITDNANCWATINPITVEQGATYTLQMDATWTWACAYDDDDKFVKELFTSTGNNNYTYTFTAPTSKIRYGCYDPSKALSYCTLTKTS